MSHTTELIYR